VKSENKLKLPGDYRRLLAEGKERIRGAQYAALSAVNKELVGLYWDIGRMIVERQEDAAHGASIAEKLAADLRTEFPGMAGFSRRNVFYMRECFTCSTKTRQKCNQWLHKSAGRITSSFSSTARMRRNGSFTSG
jgi:hypothetical protein